MDDILLICNALAIMTRIEPCRLDKYGLVLELSVTSAMVILYYRTGWGRRNVLGAWGRGLGRGTRRGS